MDNNHIENLIRPIALGRRNWLFAGSERAGKRAAAIMSLIQSARLNGLDPYAYLKDVLDRLPRSATARSKTCCPITGSPSPLQAEPAGGWVTEKLKFKVCTCPR